MRLSRQLLAGLKDWTPFRWKLQWEHEARFFEKPLQVPPALVEKGVEIVAADDIVAPKFEQWYPPVPDDPRWAQEVPLEEQPDWKDEPALSFNHDTQIYEGVKQACALAKAQHFECLPDAVNKLVGAVETPNRDLLLQRYIMLSQVWNTDMTHMPRRKAPEHRFLWRFMRKHNFGITPMKSSQILMRNLLRMCKSHTSKFPSLEKRRHLYEPQFQSYVMYKDQAIVQRESFDCLVTSDSWLSPFASTEVMDDSVGYTVPDIWPVLPTVDFPETNNYEVGDCTGFSSDFPNCIPHTIIHIPRAFNWAQRTFDWSDSQFQASQIMSSLMYTAALARRRFGDDVKILPEPISIQHISLLPSHFMATYFQLNTLDLDSDTGVKNLVWTAPRSQMFEKVLAEPWMEGIEQFEHLKAFHGDGFEPFLAAYLNGCSGLDELSAES